MKDLFSPGSVPPVLANTTRFRIDQDANVIGFELVGTANQTFPNLVIEAGNGQTAPIIQLTDHNNVVFCEIYPNGMINCAIFANTGNGGASDNALVIIGNNAQAAPVALFFPGPNQTLGTPTVANYDDVGTLVSGTDRRGNPFIRAGQTPDDPIAGELKFLFDPTVGATKFKIIAKDLDGNIRTADISLT